MLWEGITHLNATMTYSKGFDVYYYKEWTNFTIFGINWSLLFIKHVDCYIRMKSKKYKYSQRSYELEEHISGKFTCKNVHIIKYHSCDTIQMHI